MEGMFAHIIWYLTKFSPELHEREAISASNSIRLKERTLMSLKDRLSSNKIPTQYSANRIISYNCHETPLKNLINKS